MGDTIIKIVSRLAGLVLRLLIYAYRYLLAPVFVGNCRFEPSCSAYALEAVEAHGPWRGARMALGRILRCHPWGGTGHDPVPAATRTRIR